jgi:hypothetical protein
MLDEYIRNVEFPIDIEVEEHPGESTNLVDDPVIRYEQLQPITRHSIDRFNRTIELKQSHRLDNAWQNLREMEKVLIRRKVPRLMLLYNDRKFILFIILMS